MQEKRSNADRSEETRAALIVAARALFTEKGYADTGTPELVAKAGVTRGALYHHFKDKQALFHAVVEKEAREIAGEIGTRASGAASPVSALVDGARAYFEAMRRPGRVRLMLVDGPAVLGPGVMREIDMATGGGELRSGIETALGANATPQQVAVTSDLISAMFDRAALAIADGESADDYADTLSRILMLIAAPES